MQKRSGLFLLLSLVLIAGELFSQNLPDLRNEIKKLDSLVLNMNFTDVKTQLNKITKVAGKDSLLSEINNRINNYYSSLDVRLTGVEKNSPALSKKHLEGFKNEENHYINEHRGKKAENAWLLFLQNLDKSQYFDAYKYINIARFLAKTYLEEKFLSLWDSFNNAASLHAASKVDESKSILLNMKYPFRPTQNIKNVKDSADALLTTITDSEKIKNLKAKQWSSTILPSTRFTIFGGASLLYRNSVSDGTLKYNGGEDELKIDKISGGMELGFILGTEFAITNSIFVGAQFDYSKLNYTNEEGNSNYYFDLNVKRTAYHVYCKYLTRPYVGIQPFVELGFGNVNFVREETNINYILLFGNDNSDNHRAILIEEDEKSMYQILYTGGLHYVPGADSIISIGAKLTMIQQAESYEFVNQFAFGCSLFLRASL